MPDRRNGNRNVGSKTYRRSSINKRDEHSVLSEHYKVQRKEIGQGTFGTVHRGVHRLSGVEVAIKILVKSRIKDESDIERISREISILKRVKHPNIVRLFQVIDTPKHIYLCMEFAHGGELFHHIVENTRIDDLNACRIFHQCVNAVDYCHRHGIIHRDLKPENLLFDRHKLIKLVDFGLGTTIHSHNQLLNTHCGSPCYAAPEMVKQKDYIGQRADIWSLGVILYALLCGYLPFEHENQNKLYKLIIRGIYKTPSFISGDAKDLLSKILETDPEKRYTILQIRRHQWFKQCSVLTDPLPDSIQTDTNKAFNPATDMDLDILNQLVQLGYEREAIIESLTEEKHDLAFADYHLLLIRKKQFHSQGGTLDKLLAEYQRRKNHPPKAPGLTINLAALKRDRNGNGIVGGSYDDEKQGHSSRQWNQKRSKPGTSGMNSNTQRSSKHPNQIVIDLGDKLPPSLHNHHDSPASRARTPRTPTSLAGAMTRPQSRGKPPNAAASSSTANQQSHSKSRAAGAAATERSAVPKLNLISLKTRLNHANGASPLNVSIGGGSHTQRKSRTFGGTRTSRPSSSTANRRKRVQNEPVRTVYKTSVRYPSKHVAGPPPATRRQTSRSRRNTGGVSGGSATARLSSRGSSRPGSRHQRRIVSGASTARKSAVGNARTERGKYRTSQEVPPRGNLTHVRISTPLTPRSSGTGNNSNSNNKGELSRSHEYRGRDFTGAANNLGSGLDSNPYRQRRERRKLQSTAATRTTTAASGSRTDRSAVQSRRDSRDQNSRKRRSSVLTSSRDFGHATSKPSSRENPSNIKRPAVSDGRRKYKQPPSLVRTERQNSSSSSSRSKSRQGSSTARQYQSQRSRVNGSQTSRVSRPPSRTSRQVSNQSKYSRERRNSLSSAKKSGGMAYSQRTQRKNRPSIPKESRTKVMSGIYIEKMNLSPNNKKRQIDQHRTAEKRTSIGYRSHRETTVNATKRPSSKRRLSNDQQSHRGANKAVKPRLPVGKRKPSRVRPTLGSRV